MKKTHTLQIEKSALVDHFIHSLNIIVQSEVARDLYDRYEQATARHTRFVLEQIFPILKHIALYKNYGGWNVDYDEHVSSFRTVQAACAYIRQLIEDD